MGLEPTVYPVTGDRFSQLNYGRMWDSLTYLRINSKRLCRRQDLASTLVRPVALGLATGSQSRPLARYSSAVQVHSASLRDALYCDDYGVSAAGLAPAT